MNEPIGRQSATFAPTAIGQHDPKTLNITFQSASIILK